MPHQIPDPTWPQTSCGAQTGSQLLANVVSRALQQNPPQWTAVYLAGWCAIDHVLPAGIPPPPQRTACQYAQLASNAANSGQWATVISELNHGQGGPPGSTPSDGEKSERRKLPLDTLIERTRKRLPRPRPKAKGKRRPPPKPKARKKPRGSGGR